MTHHLKCDPSPFQHIADGFKKFEIRRNDRPFTCGDRIILHETKHSAPEMTATASACPLIYTGRMLELQIDHKMTEGPGLDPAFVIMSITLVNNSPQL